MTANELRKNFIDFFISKNHKQITGASLIPENDPTVLFTTAGMHPLVPYLLGQKHPAGKRLVNYQKCIRTGDIDSVGDPHHLTFFEMLGNWSLGDYFKDESIRYSFEFLTKVLKIDKSELSVTVFKGDNEVPEDDVSASTWLSLGISKENIYYLGREDNWWGPAGNTGPCGPDTEIFIDTKREACSKDCKPGCSCGKYFEIWNNVFMAYFKDENGSYKSLEQKNVDTGMGVERTITILQGKNSVYDTELFTPIISKIEELSGLKYKDNEDNDQSIRIIADHIRTTVFLLGDQRGVLPSNLGQGYILRRLIRRAVRHARKLNIPEHDLSKLAAVVIDEYKDIYPELKENEKIILSELPKEEDKFLKTLEKGEAEFLKMLPNLLRGKNPVIPGRLAFKLYDTYGFPIELTKELAREKGISVDEEGFAKAFEKHQEASKGDLQAGVAKGGLADHSEETTALHTATHLLHKALRTILGEHVQQKGSNITAERLRFDFIHPEKMSDEEIKAVEDMVNNAIKSDYKVVKEVMSLEEAKRRGAIAFFDSKYGEEVSVYSVGDYSMEVCGGPHVEHTGNMGKFKITKEQSSSSGVRRIRAILQK